MHKHDQGCDWVHREFPQWQGCQMRVDCDGVPFRVTFRSLHGGRVWRTDSDVCADHVKAYRDALGATSWAVNHLADQQR